MVLSDIVSYYDSKTDDGLSTLVKNLSRQAANRKIVFLFQKLLKCAAGESASKVPCKSAVQIKTLLGKMV